MLKQTILQSQQHKQPTTCRAEIHRSLVSFVTVSTRRIFCIGQFNELPHQHVHRWEGCPFF